MPRPRSPREPEFDHYLDLLYGYLTKAKVSTGPIVSGWFLAYIAIKNRWFESIFISVSEIFESVPVIAFFPTTVAGEPLRTMTLSESSTTSVRYSALGSRHMKHLALDQS